MSGEARARVVVGLALFCGVPAVIGAALLGWVGLLWIFAAPVVALFFACLFALAFVIEWVFGASPGQQRDRGA